MSDSHTSFADRLASRIDSAGAPLCVGLDPVSERLPSDCWMAGAEPHRAIARFDAAVIEAVAPVAAAVKFQAACYERCGAEGWAALAAGARLARSAGLVTILDGKRGDIGISAAHYAASARHTLGVDAVTANCYLGPSAITPFLDEGLGVFCLVRTSNPDSDALQSQWLGSGVTVAEHVAGMVRDLGRGHVGERGLSDVGAVVGATKTSGGEAERLRAAMPHQIVLVPGIGAQGGRIEDLKPLVRSGGRSPGDLGVLATASRSVIYAGAEDGTWPAGVAEEARRLAKELEKLHG